MLEYLRTCTLKLLIVQDVEVLLQEMASLSVNIPELALLKQYQIDASLSITKFNDVMINIHQREDQQSVINELNRILEDGESLKIQGSSNSSI